MLDLYTVDSKYLQYLRTFDKKVLINHGIDRPYLGIILTFNTSNQTIKYFAPLSSPKKKHLSMKNTIDFIKINNGTLGAINLNNMIPLINGTYSKIKINSLSDKKYKILLRKQYNWITTNQNSIITKAKNLTNKKNMINYIHKVNVHRLSLVRNKNDTICKALYK